MKKVIAVIFILLMSGRLFAQDQLPQLTRKTVSIAYTDYPPYEFPIQGGVDGLTIRKMRAAADMIGLTINFVYIPWTRALYMVKSGQVDGILSLNHTKERESFLRFPEMNLAENRESLFSLKSKNIPLIKNYSQLPPYSIGVIDDYTYGKEFDALTDLKKVFSRDDTNLIERLNKQWIDLIIVSEKVFYFQIKRMKQKKDDYVLHPLVLNREGLTVGFSKKIIDSELLVKHFNRALKKVTQEYDNELQVNEYCSYGTGNCGIPVPRSTTSTK